MPKPKIDHVQRNRDARQGFDRLAKQAHELGGSNLVRRWQPSDIDGWAWIEKANAVLRRYIEEEGEKES